MHSPSDPKYFITCSSSSNSSERLVKDNDNQNNNDDDNNNNTNKHTGNTNKLIELNHIYIYIYTKKLAPSKAGHELIIEAMKHMII